MSAHLGFYLLKRLAHPYQMTRLVWMLIWRKGQRSAFNIPEPMIKRRQLRTQIHDGEVHKTATRRATVLLGGRNQARSEAGTLRFRIDREQPELSTLVTQFHVHATRENASVFGEQKLSFLHQGANFFRVGTVGGDEETLRAESGIHQPRNILGIVELCRTCFHGLLLHGRGCPCLQPWMSVHGR
jgi:hypothetical protein